MNAEHKARRGGDPHVRGVPRRDAPRAEPARRARRQGQRARVPPQTRAQGATEPHRGRLDQTTFPRRLSRIRRHGAARGRASCDGTRPAVESARRIRLSAVPSTPGFTFEAQRGVVVDVNARQSAPACFDFTAKGSALGWRRSRRFELVAGFLRGYRLYRLICTDLFCPREVARCARRYPFRALNCWTRA